MIQPYITYRRAKKVEIVSPRETMICLDGEIIKGSRFTVENAPGALRFILPEGAAHTGKGVDMSFEKAV